MDYVHLAFKNLRSTYSLRSEKDEQGVRQFYNKGIPWIQGKGTHVGGSEMVHPVDRPTPEESTRSKRPCRRHLNTKDHENKRRRRDEWAGQPERGEWMDVDQEMRELARTPPADADSEAWLVEQIEAAISNPGKCGRVIIQEGDELQHGRILGEGSLARCEAGPSVEVRICTLADTFTREFTTPRLLELCSKDNFHFLPERMPSGKRGQRPVLLVPWGNDTEPPVEEVPDSKVWMALCVGCGRWRTIPFQTRDKFRGRKAQFYCKHSPWIKDCTDPLNACEAKYKRVGQLPADRRGGE